MLHCTEAFVVVWWYHMALGIFVLVGSGHCQIPVSLTCINLNRSVNISNHMPCKMWGEITHPFPNFNGSTLKFGNGWVISSTLYNERIFFLSMLGLKLNHVGKRNLMAYYLRISRPSYKPHSILLTHPCAKWPPFRRRYFQMRFREWKVLYFG